MQGAASAASRQVIGEEVERFLRSSAAGGGAEVEDIGLLEDAIRNRLAGRTGASGRAERLEPKKALFSRDEWSRIALYVAHTARQDERRRGVEATAGKRRVAAGLQAQVAEAQQRRWVKGGVWEAQAGGPGRTEF